MSTKARKVISSWINEYLPKEMAFGDIVALAKAAQINPGSIRQIRTRESVSAETIISVMLARGVSEEDLISLPQRGDVKYSKSLNEWNQLGSTISEKQREHVVKLIKFLLADWKIK